MAAEKAEQYVRSSGINIGKDGRISEKSYQFLLDLMETDTLPATPAKAPKPNGATDLYFTSADGRVSIHRQDAIRFLKGLPANSVDLIVTDPAYSGMNQRLKLGSGKIIGRYADAGKDGAKWFEEFHDTEENYTEFIEQCYRVLKNNRHIYIMFDSYSLLSLAPIVRKVFEVKNVLCWDKANIGLGHYFRRRHEFILFASKGRRPISTRSIPDIWKIKRIVSAKYPTQKPTEVFELMMKASAQQDFLVCDPFLGSGSAAIAAIRSGCRFVGSDIADKALSFSTNRVEVFLKDGKDPNQPNSHVSDDEAMMKLFGNG